jgi:hypothetical protein
MNQARRCAQDQLLADPDPQNALGRRAVVLGGRRSGDETQERAEGGDDRR